MTISSRRRLWTLISILGDNILFAACIYGFPGIYKIFQHYGYSERECCNPDLDASKCSSLAVEYSKITDIKQQQDFLNNDDSLPCVCFHQNKTEYPWHGFKMDRAGDPFASGYAYCSDQESTYTSWYTIIVNFQSVSALLSGIILDKYGVNFLRGLAIGGLGLSLILWCIDVLFFRNSILIFIALFLNGPCGLAYVISSFKFGNLFPEYCAVIMAVVIGTYSMSSVVFTWLKSLYLSYFQWETVIILYTIVWAFSSMNNFFIVFPTWTMLKEGTQEEKQELKKDTDDVELKEFEKKEVTEEKPSYVSLIKMPLFWLIMMIMAITQLKIINFGTQIKHSAYFYSVQELKSNMSEAIKLEEKYNTANQFMQNLCIPISVCVGLLLNFKVAGTIQKYCSETKIHWRLERRYLMNLFFSYFILCSCIILSSLIGIMINMGVLEIIYQYPCIIMVATARIILHSSAALAYEKLLPAEFFGVLTGLGSAFGALFGLLQKLLDTKAQEEGRNGIFAESFLFFVSLITVALPVILLVKARRLRLKQQI